MKHLWEVDHDYYCNEGNYFSNDCGEHYKSWSEFISAEGDAEMNYNLVFRWDWTSDTDETGEDISHDKFDDNYRGYFLKIFWMGQRKGIYRYSIVEVCRADEPKVIEFLKPRWEHLKSLWSPLDQESTPESLDKKQD